MKRPVYLSTTMLLASAAFTLSAAPLSLKKGDHIAIIGNTLADRMQHDGYLETVIQAAHPEQELVIRNLGFSADEIKTRPRSAEFGSPDRWLDETGSTVVFAFFGYNESFHEDPATFKKDCMELISQTRKAGRQIVLFSPIAHENLGNPNLPDGSGNNVRLAAITVAMAEVAVELKVPYVDLFAPTKAEYAKASRPLTINGIHLNDQGNAFVASAISKQLFGGKQDPTAHEKLRAAVLDKNMHWWSRYRTVDGFNVYGGRSALSWHGQSNYDVMQREMQIFDAMTANRDKRIWAVAQGSEWEVDDSNTPEPIPVKTNRPGKLDDGAYTYLGGEEAIGQMTVHSKMTINLFASEEQFPELINPVQMAVDTDGRLFAAVWPTYPHWNPKKPRTDKLVILPDEDGDGKADKLIVFAEDLNSVTGFEFWGGGVLVAAAPEILFLKDTDGDDRADVRIHMLQGVSSADSHHTANGLVIGPNGKLHYSRGVFHVTNMETPTHTFRSTNSGVYRFDPRTFEVDHHFDIGPNPHGNSFDAWGFQYATDGTGGAGYYIAIGHGQRAPHPLYAQRVRPVPASGILGSSHFSEELQGNFLICNAIGFLGVLSHDFKYDGGDITCEEVEPIVFSADPNFRPSDIEIGGDGALYIADWQQALIGHMQHNIRDPNRDDRHGRVYRLTQKDRPLLTRVRLKNKPITEVLAQFKQPSEAVRYRARLELSGRDSKAATAAAAAFAQGLDPAQPVDAQALLECLWVHSEHRRPDLTLAEKAYGAADPRIRAAVIRTVGWWLSTHPQGLSLVTRGAHDSERLVRAEALLAAAQAEPGPAAAEVVFIAGSQQGDAQIESNIDWATKQLNLNQIVADQLKSGGKLSPVGEMFMVKRSDNRTLLRMARNELVDGEILVRGGVSIEERWKALNGLADATGKPAASILVNTIQQADAAAPISDWARMLSTMNAKQLAQVKAQIKTLQQSAENPILRLAATAALINAGDSASSLLKAALSSRESLAAFLDAVPLIIQPEQRAALYPQLRVLAMDLPANLREETLTRNKGKGVQFMYYDQVSNARRETLEAWTPKVVGTLDRFAHQIPDQRMDGFSLRLESWVKIPVGGAWKFSLASDDGSRMYLDGEAIIDHDGNHGMSEEGSSSIQLTAGLHQLIVTYFDSGGGDGLQVYWEGPGTKKSEIPVEALQSDGGDALERLAVVALTHAPNHDKERFADFVTLLAKGRQPDLAIATLTQMPEDAWPQNQLAPLAEALTAYLPETPVEERDSPAFKESVALAEKVAAKIPSTQAAALRKVLADADLAVIRIRTIPTRMLYDRTTFTVKAGKSVKIILENPDALPHNLVVVQLGAAEEVAKAAEQMGTVGFEKQFIPEHGKILHAMKKLVNQDQTGELAFVAPEKPGAYDYVCTFPGHWMLMRGVMNVIP
ncbi:MAG: azurin [Candidatus Omnitrophota bacterium]|jgi:azurin